MLSIRLKCVLTLRPENKRASILPTDGYHQFSKQPIDVLNVFVSVILPIIGRILDFYALCLSDAGINALCNGCL